MTKTLLDGVNDVLDRVGILDANGELASLTNQGKQLFIDLAVQIWNETVDEVCNMMGPQHPGEEIFNYTSIVLEDGNRTYALPANLVQIRWPLISTIYGYRIDEYPGGYEQFRQDQFDPDNVTGMPTAAVFMTFDREVFLYLDRTPTAAEAGTVFELLYDTDLVMEAYDDNFPFNDATYRALLPVVTEGWERRKRNDFDLEEYRKHLARALNFVNRVNRRTHW